MQAIANTTTSIEERSGRPAKSSANGRITSAKAATMRRQFVVRASPLLELLDAFAK